MTDIRKRYFFCETCGDLFYLDRCGICVTQPCRNCTQPADMVDKKTYDKLVKQKEKI